MPLIPRLVSLWRNLLQRGRVERELAEEIDACLEMLTQAKVAEGLNPEEARRAALIELGGVEQVKESVREVRVGHLFRTVWQDLRYGVRSLRKSPGFTAVVVLTLALGVGANTAIFSVVNALLLRPLPYPNAGRLVSIKRVDPRVSVGGTISYPNFKDFREQAPSLEHAAAFSASYAWLGGGAEPERIEGVYASADLFPTLGVSPALGRAFAEEEDRPGAPLVAVISHGLWQRRFGSDRGVVGREILLDGEKTTVVGVMPAGFNFPFGGEAMEFWVPLGSSAYGEMLRNRAATIISVVASLKPGADIRQARAELESVNERLADLYPEANAGAGVSVNDLQKEIVGDVRPALLVLLASVAFVLLIACANVANLLLARAATRGREMALRTALGATRGRILRQVLSESLLLSAAGGAVGLLVALWGVPLLIAAHPGNILRVAEVVIDARLLAFALGVSVLTGVLFGLAPALKASRLDLNRSLMEGGRGSSGGPRGNRVRSLLMVSEVALSLVLLVGAGLLIRSFLALLGTPPGYDSSRVLTATLDVSPASQREPARFFQQVRGRVAELPGVEAAGLTSLLPLSPNDASIPFKIEGRPEPRPGESAVATSVAVDSDFLRVMRVPLREGRALGPQDSEGAPKVVLVNEALARRYFPGEDPVGKRLLLYNTYAKSEPAAYEVVGVVGDVRHRGLNLPASPEYYVSYLQMPPPQMTLVVRSAAPDLAGMAASVRGAITEVDRGALVWEFRQMDELVSDSVAPQRFNALLLGLFALVALALAATGIFGVMSYTVAERTHEIGVRIALGARRSDILRLVVGRGMLLTLGGIALGSAAALGLTRLMSGLLYGVGAADPATFVGIALLLSAVALVACYLPARRATKVSPLIAMRYE